MVPSGPDIHNEPFVILVMTFIFLLLSSRNRLLIFSSFNLWLYSLLTFDQIVEAFKPIFFFVFLSELPFDGHVHFILPQFLLFAHPLLESPLKSLFLFYLPITSFFLSLSPSPSQRCIIFLLFSLTSHQPFSIFACVYDLLFPSFLFFIPHQRFVRSIRAELYVGYIFLPESIKTSLLHFSKNKKSLSHLLILRLISPEFSYRHV